MGVEYECVNVGLRTRRISYEAGPARCIGGDTPNDVRERGFSMCELRATVVLVAVLLVGLGLGGCPMPEAELPEQNAPAAETPDPAGSDQDSDSSGSEPADSDLLLGDVAAGLVLGADDDDVAYSSGSTWISTSTDTFPEGAYPPGYNPYNTDGGSGTGGGYVPPGDSSSVGSSSGGDDGGDTGGGSHVLGGNWPGATHAGTVTCERDEALYGYGECSETLSYTLGLEVGAGGVLAAIPVPIFVTQDIVYAEVQYPGDTDVFVVPFENDAAFDVTISVVSASYTTGSAHVVLDVSVSWHGGNSSITATGSHTLQTQVSGSSLSYSSLTHYDAHFEAADDWEGDGMEEYDMSGTLDAE